MDGLQRAAWHDLVDVLDVEGLEEEDKLCLDLLLLLESLHRWHLQAVYHLPEHLEDAVDPRIAQFEDERLGALFHDVARERNN